MRAAKFLAATAVSIAAPCTAAQADVQINNKATSNMSCVSGVCTATAQKAVLNVGELQTMLAGGAVTVKTGTLAKDISLDQPLSWTGTSRLTFDAQRSVILNKQVTVMGPGSLTVTTNDNGQPKNKSGEFIIVPERGSVQLWDSSSSLIIDGHTYTLVYDIKTLAADVAANPSGYFALAKPYDASVDGTYSGAAVLSDFQGIYEGLGNSIAKFRVSFVGYEGDLYGLFAQVAVQGIVRHFGLLNANVTGPSFGRVIVGAIVGNNNGLVDSCWVTGAIKAGTGGGIGAIAGANGGLIERAHGGAKIESSGAEDVYLGGVAGVSNNLKRSYSTGSIKVIQANGGYVGGLVGYNLMRVNNSYSLTKIQDGRANCCEAYFGGLAGKNGLGARIVSSYAAGRIRSGSRDTILGGFIGFDASKPGSLSDNYWDLEKGVGNPSQGAGNLPNDSGITGLGDEALKSGLPDGFSQKIWSSEPNKNKGYPFLK
ncbi:MAG: hypothetical protein JO056_11810 [Alphaproteobacteria bacterium]|nr:hypothetical protein [Alphaproteobacteria bacterium]